MEAIQDLRRLGVSVKLISGDTKLVAQHVASMVGMSADRVLTGKELDQLHDEALWHAAERGPLCRGRSTPEGAHHSRAQKDGGMLSGSWATASMTPPRYTQPIPIFPLNRRWMWPRKRRISCS